MRRGGGLRRGAAIHAGTYYGYTYYGVTYYGFFGSSKNSVTHHGPTYYGSTYYGAAIHAGAFQARNPNPNPYPDPWPNPSPNTNTAPMLFTQALSKLVAVLRQQRIAAMSAALRAWLLALIALEARACFVT